MSKKVLLALGLSVGIIAGCTAEEEPKEKVEKPKEEEAVDVVEEPKEEVEEEVVEEPEPVYNIGYTAESFKDALVKTYRDLGNDTIVNNMEVKIEDNALSITLTNSTVIMGYPNEDGTLKSIHVVGGGFDGQVEALDYILATAVTVAIVNPELQPNERGELVMNKLQFEELLTNGKGRNTTKQGNIQYSLNLNGGILMLSATHIDDPENK